MLGFGRRRDNGQLRRTCIEALRYFRLALSVSEAHSATKVLCLLDLRSHPFPCRESIEAEVLLSVDSFGLKDPVEGTAVHLRPLNSSPRPAVGALGLSWLHAVGVPRLYGVESYGRIHLLLRVERSVPTLMGSLALVFGLEESPLRVHHRILLSLVMVMTVGVFLLLQL